MCSDINASEMAIQAEDSFGRLCNFYFCGICGIHQYVFSDFLLSDKEGICPFFCIRSLKQNGCRQDTFDLIFRCHLRG